MGQPEDVRDSSFVPADRAARAAAEEARPPVAHADLRGLRCPLPVLRSARRLMMLAPGERLEILCDDPLAAIDLPNFCRQEGQRLVEASREADHARFVIERGERAPDLDKGQAPPASAAEPHSRHGQGIVE